jgi:hypothetical protein
MSLFRTKRQPESSDGRYSYTITSKARARVLHTLQQHRPNPWSAGGFDFGGMLSEVGRKVLAKSGGLATLPDANPMADHPVVVHFLACSDEEALQFIGFCFETEVMSRDMEGANVAVEAVNKILEEEGIGYELTRQASVDTGEPGYLFGRRTGGNMFRTEYPRLVKKGDRVVHEQAVKPALEALRDSRFNTAHGELLKAFDEVRRHEYGNAITSCGCAFESVLRTICSLKGWAYDPNKDTCATLVDICRANGLFPPLYTEMLKGVGTIRNKVGAAHGKGPAPVYVATRDHAEHMVAVTCAHIDFLMRVAGL